MPRWAEDSVVMVGATGWYWGGVRDWGKGGEYIIRGGRNGY